MDRSTLLASLACLLIACAPQRTLAPDQTDPVRIGLILPLDGESSSDAPSWRDAVELAVREVNAAGGALPGRRVELLIESSDGDDELAVERARALADAGVVAIIGEASNSATLAIYDQVALPEQILLASGRATATELTGRNQAQGDGNFWFFRTVPSDDLQARALATAVRGDCATSAILYADDEYGRPLGEGMQTRYAELGGQIVHAAAFEPNLADYGEEVSALAAVDPAPECVTLIAYPQSGSRIVRNWYGLSSRPPVSFYGTDTLRDSAFERYVANEAYLENFWGTAPVTEPPRDRDGDEIADEAWHSYSQFADAFRATSSGEPAPFSASMYDAAALVLLAIAYADRKDPFAIRDSILALNDPEGQVVQAGELAYGIRLIRDNFAINYEGASGSVNVGSSGDIDEGLYELWYWNPDSDQFERSEFLDE